MRTVTSAALLAIALALQAAPPTSQPSTAPASITEVEIFAAGRECLREILGEAPAAKKVRVAAAKAPVLGKVLVVDANALGNARMRQSGDWGGSGWVCGFGVKTSEGCISINYLSEDPNAAKVKRGDVVHLAVVIGYLDPQWEPGFPHTPSHFVVGTGWYPPGYTPPGQASQAKK